jgi:hypothetical protein
VRQLRDFIRAQLTQATMPAAARALGLSPALGKGTVLSWYYNRQSHPDGRVDCDGFMLVSSPVTGKALLEEVADNNASGHCNGVKATKAQGEQAKALVTGGKFADTAKAIAAVLGKAPGELSTPMATWRYDDNGSCEMLTLWKNDAFTQDDWDEACPEQ